MAVYVPETVESMRARGISVANLLTISLAKLHAKEPTELDRLNKGASNTGFFYLDLRGDTEGDRLLGLLPEIYALGDKYFAQPKEAKVKDIRHDIKPSQDIGYKSPPGREGYEISRDEVASMGVSHLPQMFQDQGKKITEFIAGCDEACLTLLNSLSLDFAVHHRPNEPSDTGLSLVRAPSSPKLSDVPNSTHTDGGTLTMLFYDEWSLQAFLPDAKIWAFTPILEGCVLVNVANSLEKLSGGKLHSPRHRVTQPFDGEKDRLFLSYFLRPENALKEKWEAAK
ncbi:hypothetical protein BGZ60DRAFT_474569 [Tricladium varicosporioides]|nr:hypothetical protein BGZ60DRAFT_474569 [Hymenoscyphus varicosporioides]